MKILVPIRAVQDARGGWIANPSDEVALDDAVRLRSPDDTVVAFAISADPIARSALARGADRSIVATGADDAQAITLTEALAATEAFDLVIGGQGMPGLVVTSVAHSPQPGKVRATRQVNASRDGWVQQRLDLPLPATIAIDTRGRLPEIISLYAIVGARDKKVEVYEAAALHAGDPTATPASGPEPPAPRLLTSVTELVAALREQLSVLRPAPMDASALPIGAKVIASEKIPAALPDIQNARIVVAGGRSLGDATTFDALIGGLARTLGAAVAASGGAVHSGIAPATQLVGQTGQTIAPDLYIAVGISGADQHVGGMQNSRVIVAINDDPEAAIFRVAHYGLVGDYRTVVPELIAELAT